MKEIQRVRRNPAWRLQALPSDLARARVHSDGCEKSGPHPRQRKRWQPHHWPERPRWRSALPPLYGNRSPSILRVIAGTRWRAPGGLRSKYATPRKSRRADFHDRKGRRRAAASGLSGCKINCEQQWQTESAVCAAFRVVPVSAAVSPRHTLKTAETVAPLLGSRYFLKHPPICCSSSKNDGDDPRLSRM